MISVNQCHVRILVLAVVGLVRLITPEIEVWHLGRGNDVVTRHVKLQESKHATDDNSLLSWLHQPLALPVSLTSNVLVCPARLVPVL